MGSCEKALFNDKSTPNADSVSTSIASRKSITNKETTYIRALPHHYPFYMGAVSIYYIDKVRGSVLKLIVRMPWYFVKRLYTH